MFCTGAAHQADTVDAAAKVTAAAAAAGRSLTARVAGAVGVSASVCQDAPPPADCQGEVPFQTQRPAATADRGSGRLPAAANNPHSAAAAEVIGTPLLAGWTGADARAAAAAPVGENSCCDLVDKAKSQAQQTKAACTPLPPGATSEGRELQAGDLLALGKQLTRQRHDPCNLVALDVLHAERTGITNIPYDRRKYFGSDINSQTDASAAAAADDKVVAGPSRQAAGASLMASRSGHCEQATSSDGGWDDDQPSPSSDMMYGY